MMRYASGIVLAILGLGTSCGGKTSSTATGHDPGSGVRPAPIERDAGSAATACRAIVIDDMEAKTGPDPTPGGGAFWWEKGIGNWFYDPKGDAPAVDLTPPRAESTRARRLQSPTMGNGLRCQLNHPQNAAVDLSMYAGITFWACLSGAGGRLAVTRQGKDSAPSGPELFTQEVNVSDTWTAFNLPFAGQATSGDGNGANVVTAFDFKILDVEAHDLWIDDLALACPSLP